MSGTFYVYSTLTASNRYVNHEPSGNDLPMAIGDGILIEGGAGVAGKNLITPRGVVSGPFTKEQIEYLFANPVFQLHEKNGFITVDDKAVDPDKVAADMASRDRSAPTVEQDFPDGQAPTTDLPESGGTKKRK